MKIAELKSLGDQIVREVERAIVGKHELLMKMMAAFLTPGGHILLEDYPGLAKTLIANSFADVLGLSFRRIQLPADIILTGRRISLSCAKDLCLRILSWRMKSTGRRRARSRRCWRRCRNTR